MYIMIIVSRRFGKLGYIVIVGDNNVINILNCV